jgi:dihydroflavonol-4-reductase
VALHQALSSSFERRFLIILMKIFVTGATGFLGQHLCRRLVEDGYEVTALRRSSSDTALLAGLDLDFATGDVTDQPSLEAAMRGQEAVVHAAGHLAYWSRLRATQNQVNIEGTRNVVAASQRAGIRRLLYVSSVAAIGIPDRGQLPADESFPFNLESSPLNYPVSKKRAEQLVNTGCKNGLDAVIVNPGALLGKWGRYYRGSEGVEKIRKRPVAFYYTGGRNLVHVADVVDGILCALEHGRSGERYILGGENLTYLETARIAAARLGRNILLLPVLPLVTRLLSALDPMISSVGRRPPVTRETHFTSSRFQYYSSAKAERELGYLARPFSDILEDMLQWYDQRSGFIA